MEDKQILELYWARSEQAIAETGRKYGAPVRRVALNILRDEQDADECVNDTWLGAWNSIPPSRPDPLRSFVCRIARNLATKRYHANRAEKRNSQYDLALDELSECIPDSQSVEEACEARELAAGIDRFLDTLSYEDRFLFMRRYWYADSLPDAARMAGMRYGTAAVRLHRVKEKLKQHLQKEGLLV